MLQTVKSYRVDMESLERQIPAVAQLPVRLIWGERDPVIPPGTARQLMGALPSGGIRVLPDVGHLPYEEAPEEFAHAVNESLAD